MTLILRICVRGLTYEEKEHVKSIKMRINEDEMKRFDSETSELKISKDFFIFTQRTSIAVSTCYMHRLHLELMLFVFYFDLLYVNYQPKKDNFPFDLQALTIKFELTSKTVIMESVVHEEPQSTG